jgi:hypothetical protein
LEGFNVGRPQAFGSTIAQTQKDEQVKNKKFRLGIFAIVATVTTALNVILFLLATAGGASMVVTSPMESTLGIVTVLAATFVALMFAAAVLKLILNKFPGFAVPASWLGFGFAAISSVSPFLAVDELFTGAALATMHVVAGLGWLVGVRVAHRPE